MVIDSGGAPGVWMRSGMGRTLGIGAGLAIIAVLLVLEGSAMAVARYVP